MVLWWIGSIVLLVVIVPVLVRCSIVCSPCSNASVGHPMRPWPRVSA